MGLTEKGMEIGAKIEKLERMTINYRVGEF